MIYYIIGGLFFFSMIVLVYSFNKIMGNGSKEDELFYNEFFFKDGTPRKDFKWIRIF